MKEKTIARVVLPLALGITIVVFQLQLASLADVKSDFWRSGSPSYGTLAHSLAEGYGLTLDRVSPTAYRPPLYPLFLASFLPLRWPVMAIIIAQSVLAGLTISLLTVLATRYVRSRWSLLFIPFQYLLLFDIAYENLQQRETVLFSFLIVLAGLLLTREEEAHRNWIPAILGICLGLACLTRPYASGGVLLIGAWAWRLRRQSVSWHEIGQRVSVFAVCFSLVLLPWGIRNARQMGQFNVSSTTTGINLWKGNNPATVDLYPYVDLDLLSELYKGSSPSSPGWWDALRGVEELSEIEQNQHLFRLGRAFILSDPLHFINMGFLKLYGLWSPFPVPQGRGHAEWIPSGAYLTTFSSYPPFPLAYLILYLCAAVGIWRLRKESLTWYLLVWIFYTSLIHFVTFGETRFRWPLCVLALPIATAGLETLVNASLSKTRTLLGKLGPRVKSLSGRR